MSKEGVSLASHQEWKHLGTNRKQRLKHHRTIVKCVKRNTEQPCDSAHSWHQYGSTAVNLHVTPGLLTRQTNQCYITKHHKRVQYHAGGARQTRWSQSAHPPTHPPVCLQRVVYIWKKTGQHHYCAAWHGVCVCVCVWKQDDGEKKSWGQCSGKSCGVDSRGRPRVTHRQLFPRCKPKKNLKHIERTVSKTVSSSYRWVEMSWFEIAARPRFSTFDS